MYTLLKVTVDCPQQEARAVGLAHWMSQVTHQLAHSIHLEKRHWQPEAEP